MELPWAARRAPVLHVASDRGDGPPVVMLHGIASSSVTFQNVLPLIEPTHRAITIDLLGFGRSPVPTDAEYTIDEHAAAVTAAIRRLRLREPYVLVGHSMGALIATRLASRSPALLEKLVLVSPPVYVTPGALPNPLDRSIMSLYLRAFDYLRTNKTFTLSRAKALSRFIAIPHALEVTEENWEPFVKSLEHTIESQTTISDLAAVRVPVEVVYGSLDQFRSDGAMKIVSRLSGVTVHRVVGSDHIIGKRLARVVATAIGPGRHTPETGGGGMLESSGVSGARAPDPPR